MVNGYFISGKQTKISNIKSRKKKTKKKKNMSQSFCNLRDAIEDCLNIYGDLPYCRPNCASKIVEYVLYMDNI